MRKPLTQLGAEQSLYLFGALLITMGSLFLFILGKKVTEHK